MVGVLSFEQLFDPVFLTQVEQLSLRVAQAQKGGRLADQRTSARGQGSDFADFKPYIPGDDLRAIDWNIYSRLGKAFVRVFEERQDLPVYLMVDVSRSMFVETPPRINAALRAALAVAAIAMGQLDAVTLFDFSSALNIRMRGVSGRAGVLRAAHLLAAMEPAGTTDLAAALTQLAAMRLRRGLVVIVSDFFDDGGIAGVVAALGRLPHRLMLVRMTREQDGDPTLHPDLTGDVRIEDGEGHETQPLTITPALLSAYRKVFREFEDRLTAFAADYGAGLVTVDADRDVVDQLRAALGSGRRFL